MSKGKGKGIVLSGPDKGIEARARSKKLGVVVARMEAETQDFASVQELPFEKTVFVEAGTQVPWDLLPAAWHFLERWDAAVPLWRYGKTAADVGTKEERARTEAVVRDLRVLLHSVELLFVRDSEDGRALVAAYGEELRGGHEGRHEGGHAGPPVQEKRLAFLRAVYRVKPRLCVLPRSWLAAVQARSRLDASALRGKRRTGSRLVTVEVGPGRFVKCHPGDEDKVLEQFAGRRR